MILKRQNWIGLTFYLSSIRPEATRITFGKKELTVSAPLEEMNKAWYQWQYGGKFIQHAFPFLTADEREFLQTGLLPVEFDAITRETEQSDNC